MESRHCCKCLRINGATKICGHSQKTAQIQYNILSQSRLQNMLQMENDKIELTVKAIYRLLSTHLEEFFDQDQAKNHE